jgi:dienelactone hydrolase
MFLLPVAACAQTRFPGVTYRDYPACLPNYIRGLAAAARAKRTGELGRLTTPDTVSKRQAWAKKTLLDLIGGLPERTELNARTLASMERDGYRLEKLVYDGWAGVPISANLYIPKSGRAPYPGVLFQLGHAPNGKAYNSYQSACQGLVKLGFVVLAFDPMGQGERVYYPDSNGRSRLHDVDLEHTVPGRQMLLVGTTCTQFQLWDAIRSLDYLANHPLVNPKRIASTGQSGGATLTMLLAAVDDRLCCAAEFSGNTENVAGVNFLPPGAIDDAEQNFVGAGPLGFDRWDLFYPFAPKPMLVSISDKDSFGTYSPDYVSDSWQEYERLAAVYKLLGKSANLSWKDTPLPHGLSYDSRIHLYNWLRLHLQDKPEPIAEEPPVAPEHDEQLWVTDSGSVVKSLGGDTPFALVRKRQKKLRNATTPISLAELLRLEQSPRQCASVLRTVNSAGGCVIEALDIRSAANVSIPAWLFRARKSSSASSIVLILNPRGRNASWHEGDLCLTLAQRGYIVCAADVRGIGDLAPQVSPGAPGYEISHQKEESYAWSSLILGRPLVGQRVTDIVSVVRALQSCGEQSHPIAVAALGEMTVPALFAAALESSIASLYLADGLCSYASIAENADYVHPFANFLPKVLMHTDLPDIVTGIAPRTITIAGAVDGRGVPLSLETAREVYQSALSRRHVTLREGAGWTADRLVTFLDRHS